MTDILMKSDPIVKLLGAWSAELGLGSVVLRIALSLLLTAIIGCERSSKRHSAGLRTFMLVSFTGTVVMLCDIFVMESYGGFPLISAACVIGAAMISGNSILFSSKNQIKGLTTSAGLWSCAVLGLVAGAGLYSLTLITFATLICCMSFFPSFEMYLKNRSNHFEIHLELKNRSNLQDFITTIRKLGLRIDDIESNPAYLNSGLSVFTVSLTVSSEEMRKYKTHAEIIEALGTLEYVYHVEEIR